MSRNPRRPGHAPYMRVKWSWVVTALAALFAATLSTLIVVVTLNDVDLLSTIALALAVLAFSLQLIVSLAQAISGAQQLAHVERVNADTKSTLAAMRAAKEAVLSNQREHFSELLRAAITRSGGDEPQPAGDEVPANGVDSGVSQAVPTSILDDILRRRDSRPEPGPEYKVLSEYPEEARGRELAKIFKALTPWEAQVFSRLANNAMSRSRIGRPSGGWAADDLGPGNDGLLTKGVIQLIERLKPDGKTGRWRELTPEGLELASLVTGGGEIPEWLREEMRGA